ncbi:hypothetical protein [Methylobacterium sp. ARG-1]|uniref:hypothetical protein n=1 Tax=Methylobacterium sp. ARG-1 TaxID=1692501 RepID=UPI000AC513D6|nr:hypothetical protein [Methylobacterium sp. ARG-1]
MSLDLNKLKRLSALIEDLLDEVEDSEEGDAMAEALFEPLSQASAAVHGVLTKEAARG